MRQIVSVGHFRDLSEYYETRLQWGKEARGIVLKLGMNSVYGKLAQSVGSHRYRSLSGRAW